MIPKALPKPLDDSRPLFHLPQQQTASVAGDRSALKIGPHFPSAQGMKFEEFSVTLCAHKAVSGEFA
jgi:hypothetical protein